MQRGCFWIRTRDQSVTNAQPYSCVRAHLFWYKYALLFSAIFLWVIARLFYTIVESMTIVFFLLSFIRDISAVVNWYMAEQNGHLYYCIVYVMDFNVVGICIIIYFCFYIRFFIRDCSMLIDIIIIYVIIFLY